MPFFPMKTGFPDYKKGELLEIKEKSDKESLRILNDFLAICSRSAGKATIDKIERQVLQFQDVIEKPLSQKPTATEVACFLSLIKDKRDRQKIKCNIKRFLKWKWKDMEIIELFEFKWNRKLPSRYTENDVLSAQDIEKLIRKADKLIWKAIFILDFETGMRPSELVDLRWRDIKFKEETADIVIFSKKTGETRIYPVVNSVVHLKRWKQEYAFPDLKPEDYVFPSKKREKPLTTNAVLYNLKRNAKKIGIPENKITTYLMRHSKATELYQKLPEQVVEKLLGHKGMAKIYTHLSSEKARQELLDKIYKVEELSEEKKHELEKEIDKLKKASVTQEGEIVKLKAEVKRFSTLSEKIGYLTSEIEKYRGLFSEKQV